jgi:3-oxoacyl-[acyl-carrier protein] reductase
MGLAAAQRLASDGLRLVILDLDRAACEAAARRLSGSGHLGLALDVSREAGVAEVFARIEGDLGPISILANFAGIFPWPESGQRPAIVDTSVAEWDKTFAVNALGSFLTIREMLRYRTKSPVADGRIVNISSSAAQIGGYNGSAAYVSSKGAILSLTKLAAREAAPLGVTVNAIAPGAIDTPLLRTIMPPERDAAYAEKIPMGRIGQPSDVVSALAYLVSPEASYVTGACLDVNGGMRMQ